MPQLQVVDTTINDVEPTGVEKFFTRIGKDYKDKQDKVSFNEITERYKQNRNDINAWEDMQLEIDNSDMSPSNRLKYTQEQNERKKILIERDKALNSSVKK